MSRPNVVSWPSAVAIPPLRPLPSPPQNHVCVVPPATQRGPSEECDTVAHRMASRPIAVSLPSGVAIPPLPPPVSPPLHHFFAVPPAGPAWCYHLHGNLPPGTVAAPQLAQPLGVPRAGNHPCFSLGQHLTPPLAYFPHAFVGGMVLPLGSMAMGAGMGSPDRAGLEYSVQRDSDPGTSLHDTAMRQRLNTKTGRWTIEEHARFMEGFRAFGTDWRAISNVVASRNAKQVRLHARAFIKKPLAGRQAR